MPLDKGAPSASRYEVERSFVSPELWFWNVHNKRGSAIANGYTHTRECGVRAARNFMKNNQNRICA